MKLTFENILPYPSDEQFRTIADAFASKELNQVNSELFLKELAKLNDIKNTTVLFAKYLTGESLSHRHMNYLKGKRGLWCIKEHTDKKITITTTWYVLLLLDLNDDYLKRLNELD